MLACTCARLLPVSHFSSHCHVYSIRMGHGVNLVIPGENGRVLEGCTLTITVLDLLRGRTARLFRYTNITLVGEVRTGEFMHR